MAKFAVSLTIRPFDDALCNLHFYFMHRFIGVFVGMRETEFVSLVQQPITISVFKDGRLVSERRVLPPSNEHERLASWLAKHQSGWHSSFITYAPGVLVSGTNFTMNVLHSGVIINATGTQFVHDADDSDFQFLLHKPGT